MSVFILSKWDCLGVLARGLNNYYQEPYYYCRNLQSDDHRLAIMKRNLADIFRMESVEMKKVSLDYSFFKLERQLNEVLQIGQDFSFLVY